MGVFVHIRNFLSHPGALRFWGVIFGLFLISIAVFFLTYQHPDHIAQQICNPSTVSAQNRTLYLQGQHCLAQRLGSKLPPFYVELASWAHPDTLYRIPAATTRKAIAWQLYQYGNWDYIQRYRLSLSRLQQLDTLALARQLSQYPWRTSPLFHYLDSLQQKSDPTTSFWIAYQHSRALHAEMIQHTSRWKMYLPRLVVHGFSNHYHRWLSTLLTQGKLGIAYSRLQLRHCNCIGEAQALPGIQLRLPLWRSIALGMVSLLVVLGVGIPLGVVSAYLRDRWVDRLASGILIALDAIPPFWVASAFFVFLHLREYQERDALWQEMGIVANWETWMWALVAYAFGSLAFVSRMVRIRLLEELNQEYLRTARAKGLTQWQAIWRHGLRNALLPLVTILATTIPTLISGSVVIEKVFNYPGMGIRMLAAIQMGDWPLMISIVFLIGLFTMGGYWFTDWVYTLLDPRIKMK